jgi:hypothetical protein
MTDHLIPPDIRDFIQRHIDSVAQLEALLLLRANPCEKWDVTRIAQRLYAPEQEISSVLARLCLDQLLVCENGVYRYECGSEMQARVDRLAASYSSHLVQVTNIIHAKPRRIREFADAFRIRKDP